MSQLQCAQFEQMLEEHDGGLPNAAAAHVKGCAECRMLWSDLEAIRKAGTEWGSEEVAPPEHLWSSIRLQMESEGLIRGTTAGAGWLASWFGAVPQWALASASISLLLIAALLASYQTNVSTANNFSAAARLPAQMSTRSMREKVVEADLGKTLDGDLKRVFESLPERNPLLASSLRENLGIVDNLIAVCEKSVREEPNDALARDYLYGAYEQKAVLLATATDRSALEVQ